MATPLQRLKEFIDKKNLSVSAFERSVGMSNGSFASQLKSNRSIGVDKLENILKAYPKLNPTWVLLGHGNMEADEKNQFDTFQESTPVYGAKIPLIPVDAMAGFGGEDTSVVSAENYVVPEFKGVDFLIRVKGSSMYPKYSSGDIVACRYINELIFIQWGKVYVLDSTQGALIKRLYETTDKNSVECRSDNKDYPAFIIPRSEIRAIALVIGVIRLE